MRFISSYPHTTVLIKKERWGVDDHGTRHMIEPVTFAEFSPTRHTLSAYERTLAEQTFKKANAAYAGSAPSASGGTILDQTSLDHGQHYVGANREFGFGVFDTDTDCSPENRALFEKILLARVKDYNGDVIILVEPEKLTPPWPTYDKTRRSRGSATAIPALAKEYGVLVEAIAYEEASDKPSEAIIEKMRELLAEEQAEAQEAEALEVV